MAVDVAEERINETNTEASNNATSESIPILCDSEPNLELLDFSDGIWCSNSWTSTCAAIKDRYIRANSRFKKFTSADILACIKFENTDDDDNRRKQKRNRRVRFSTGMSISVDSLVQCNSDHQTDSRENGDHLQDRQFLKAEFLKVPPHRHLTTGENKIWNALYEDRKTVGYGRRCTNPYTSYNNPFDPRQTFKGLHHELNIANTNIPVSCDRERTIAYNGALAFIEDPTAFLNTYLNSYRGYLMSLEPPAHFNNGHESDLLDESESSINIQDTPEIDEEENKLLQKLDSIRSLWSADANCVNLEDNELQAYPNNPTPLDVDIESISAALGNLKLGGQQSPLTSTPKLQPVNTEQRGNEKVIVHTTCLSSDGQTTETMIHETILKTPNNIGPVRSDKQCANRETIPPFVPNDVDIPYPVGSIRIDIDDNTGKTPEDYDDDSDGTLTPGEEDTNVKVSPDMKESQRGQKVILQRGQTHADFVFGKKTDATQQSKIAANVQSETIESNHGVLPNAGQKKQTKLRATTEPFIPISQKVLENSSRVSTRINVYQGATTVKQNTAPTDNGPIYQTSEMFSKAQTSLPGDSTNNFHGDCHSFQPPSQQHFLSDQQLQQLNPQALNRQPVSNTTLHSQQSLAQSHPNQQPVPLSANLASSSGHPAPPPGFQQNVQHVRHQHPEQFKQENRSSTPANQPQIHRFETPKIRAPNQYHQSPNRGGHIPVQTTTSRNHQPVGGRNTRARVRNSSRQQPANNGRQWIPQANSLQGQPSNSQPVYNAFWLQFQNAGNPNIQHSVHMPPPLMGPGSNPGQTTNLRQEPPQRYGFQAHIQPQCPPQKDKFPQQMNAQQASQNFPFNDNLPTRPQNISGSMSYPVGQPNQRSVVSGPSRSLPSGPGSPYFDTHAFNTNANNNANDNAFVDEGQEYIDENLITMTDEPEKIWEAEGHNIDVLDNERSREGYRTSKKHGKRLRPIRSCLVQVV